MAWAVFDPISVVITESSSLSSLQARPRNTDCRLAGLDWTAKEETTGGLDWAGL